MHLLFRSFLLLVLFSSPFLSYAVLAGSNPTRLFSVSHIKSHRVSSPTLYVNEDGQIDISDAINIILYLFNDPIEYKPQVLDSADANDDGEIDLGDAVYLLAYLFANGPPPPAPFPESGVDPTP